MGTNLDDTYPPGSYANYLASSLWRRIKERVLKRDDRICYFCGGSASVVHHRSYARDALEGKADHLLVSLCKGCHIYVHFDDAGMWLSPDKTDIILLTRAAPKDFPEPHFYLRRRLASHLPKDWRTMNSAQRSCWQARFLEVSEQAIREAAAKNQARAASKANRPPVEDGWTRLEDAVMQYKREMVNSYEWFRREAMQCGCIRIGKSEVHAEKRPRTWCVPAAALVAAIEAYRLDPPEFVLMGMPPADH